MKKRIALSMALVLLLTLPTGCSSGAGSQNSGSETTSEAVSSGDEPVTLRFMWWGGDARHQATLEALELYSQKYPNVKIEAEYQGYDGYRDKLTTQLSGGTTADIVQFDYLWRQDLAGAGDFFIDYNDYADLIDLSQFDMNLVQPYGEINGKLFGVPTGVGPMTLSINRELFDKFGLDDSYNWTWEDLLTEGAKVNQADPESYFINFTDEYEFVVRPYIIQMTGEQFINDDYTLNFTREQLIEVFEYIRRLYDEKVAQPPEEAAIYELTENPKWLNEQIVASFAHASSIPVYFAEFPDKADVIMHPIMEGAKNSGIVCPVAQLLCVSSTSKHVEEAVKFVNAFLNDPDMVKVLGDVRSVPASKAAQDTLIEEGIINTAVQKGIDLAMSDPGLINSSLTESDELTAIAIEVCQKLRYNQLTPEQAADEFIQRFENKLEELKSAS